MIMLCYFDPREFTPSIICIGPFETHEAAAEVGAAEHTCGEFWTVEVSPPEGNDPTP
jgi:hypothetical protein